MQSIRRVIRVDLEEAQLGGLLLQCNGIDCQHPGSMRIDVSISSVTASL
jgi:hypothetical protein